jgi:outer membrane protein assembly factor BamA
MGLRFHLFLYNLANPKKEKGFSKFFHNVGEAPVVYDSNKVKQNVLNFSKYLSDIGYTHAQVTDSLRYKSNQKIDVIYKIKFGVPTKIKTFRYSFEDTSIQRYIYADTSRALIKKGMLFDKQLMQAERLRLETVLKSNGYFRFSKEYIYFNVKNAQQPNLVDIILVIKQNVDGTYNPVTRVRAHEQFTVDSITIIPETQKNKTAHSIDTFIYNNYTFLYPGKVTIKPQAILSVCRIQPVSLFSQDDVDKTYANLSALNLFRYINIEMSEKEQSEEDSLRLLDCTIELAMRKKQSYSFELGITNTSYDLGGRGNWTYNNYNIFKGGEHLQVGISGSIRSIRHKYDNYSLDPEREIGAFVSLETPKFFVPFSLRDFQNKYNPRTLIQFSFNNQRELPRYIKTIANTSFGYSFKKTSSYSKHSIYPIDFSLIKLPILDKIYFDTTFKGKSLEYSFIDHAILSMRYVYELNTQPKESNRSYVYLRSSIESAGPLVHMVNKYSHWAADSLDSLFFGVEYAQYIRGDIDFRFFHIITPANKLVYRFYGGIGIPYGNSKAMPYEKMFWSGGPYGIRAWKERSLGPGNAKNADSIPNQLGDIKLEGNIEYRFKLFWKLEGAFFTDAGNVWLLKEGGKNPGEFDFKSLPKEIAIGSGLGIRLDLAFVLLRVDWGFKIKDPSQEANKMWIFQNDNYKISNSSFQFGIGYPF